MLIFQGQGENSQLHSEQSAHPGWIKELQWTWQLPVGKTLLCSSQAYLIEVGMPGTDFKFVLSHLSLILRSVPLLRKVHAYVLFKNKQTHLGERPVCSWLEPANVSVEECYQHQGKAGSRNNCLLLPNKKVEAQEKRIKLTSTCKPEARIVLPWACVQTVCGAQP